MKDRTLEATSIDGRVFILLVRDQSPEVRGESGNPRVHEAFDIRTPAGDRVERVSQGVYRIVFSRIKSEPLTVRCTHCDAP